MPLQKEAVRREHVAALVGSRKANLLMIDENQLQTAPQVAANATSVMSSTDQLTPSVEELLEYCDALELEPMHKT